jgi:hypothetical protein
MCLQEEASPESVLGTARFRVQKQTAFGEQVCVLGSCPELGSWDVQPSLQLCWSNDHWWYGEAALPPGAHEFKVSGLQAAAQVNLKACYHDGPLAAAAIMLTC